MTGFSLQDKLGKVRLFQETFLVADTRMKVVLGMPFLPLSSAEVCREGVRLEDLHRCRSLANDQAGGTLQCEGICGGGPRGRRWSFRGACSSHGGNEYSSFSPSINCLAKTSKRSLSQSPPSIWITPTSSLRTPRRNYPSTPASTTILSTW